MKRTFNILSNSLWLLVLAPLYVKMRRFQSPSLLMVLVSGYIWLSLLFFLIGAVSQAMGISWTGWLTGIEKNPSAVFDRYFAVACIALALFYGYATLNDLWNTEEMRKSLGGEN